MDLCTVVTLVTSVKCILVQMSKYLHNTILVIISGNLLCLESYFCKEDTEIGKKAWLFAKLQPGRARL